MNPTLERFESSLDQAIGQIQTLSRENAALKQALADADSRMLAASLRLTALAGKFPALSERGQGLQ